ncbi:MAG: AAA family ATPase [Sulfobacillus sp.]
MEVLKLHLPWIEKYRPKDFSEVIDNSGKVLLLRQMLARDELPHLLFYGPPGTGKTTVAHAIAHELFGKDKKVHTLELNASDERGIDVVRNRIPSFVRGRADKIRLVILDEADAMTGEAQAALRRIMEIHSQNGRFIIICNNVTKIIPGLVSRCVRMHFGRAPPEKLIARLAEISAAENVKISHEAIETIAKTQKDFRQALSTLQCLHLNRLGADEDDAEIEMDDVRRFINAPSEEDAQEILGMLLNARTSRNSEADRGFILQRADRVQKLLHKGNWEVRDLLLPLAEQLVRAHGGMEEREVGYLLRKLAKLEQQANSCHDPEIQLWAMVSYFTHCQEKFGAS